MVDLVTTLGAINTLLTGNDVSLGSVTLMAFEIPKGIQFGGVENIVVHKLPGGLKIVHAMGSDPVPITFNGTLTGGLAVTRARQLNRLRQAQQPIILSYGPLKAQVIIREFRGSYERNGFWIPYSIACETTPASAAVAGASNSALASLVGQDAANALASVQSAAQQVQEVTATAVSEASSVLARVTPLANIAGINLGGVTAALSTGTGLIAGVTNLASAPAAVASSITQLQTAGAGIASGLSAVGTDIGSISSTAATAGSGDPASSVADINNSVALTGAAAQLSQASGYVGRASVNAASIAPPGATP